MSNFWDNAIQLTQKLKQHYDTPIMWGGTHPTVRPNECLEYADMVCISESEQPLVELTRKMAKGENYFPQFSIIPVETLDFGKHIPDNRDLQRTTDGFHTKTRILEL